MKIFSNFDTEAPLKAYKQALDQYGADKIIFFRRHRIYLTLFVTLPLVATGLGWVGLYILQITVLNGLFANSTVLSVLLVSFVVIISLMTFVAVLFSYINYLLDYTIVTPHIITSYNQTGLFKRETRTIDTDKIKSIRVSSDTFRQSFFNYGSIIVFSEGDEETAGDISLHYLRHPNDLKDEVVRVINLAVDR